MPKNLGKKIYGPHKDQYRRRIKNPEGKYRNVFGHTGAELDANEEQLRADWAAAAKEASEIYVYEYARDWFRRTAPGLPIGQQNQHRYQINKVICPVIGKLQLSAVTLDDLKDVLASRAGLAKGTQAKTVQTLKKIFSAAYEAGKISRDPSLRLSATGRKAEKRHALTPEQQQILLDAVQGLPVELFVKLGLFTGLRREEICALRWDAVQLDSKAPHIEVRRACRWIKNNKPEVKELLKSDAAWRSIPIPPLLLPDLKEQRERAEAQLKKQRAKPEEIRRRYVIAASDGGPISYSGFDSLWNQIRARSTGEVTRQRKDPETGEMKKVTVVKTLGDTVPNHTVTVTIDFDVTSHILRHTYITRLILGGIDLKRVQYLAGHADPAVTLAIYTELMGHQPEDLIDDVSGVFSAPK